METKTHKRKEQPDATAKQPSAAKKPKTESETRKPRKASKPPHTLTPDEAKTLLGQLFTRSLCSRHSSLVGPDVYRVVGCTKSRKRVILERVPQTDNGKADQAWLAQHPLTKPQNKGGKQAKYEFDSKHQPFLWMEGDAFHPGDVVRP